MLFSLLKYGTLQNETHATLVQHIWNKPMHITKTSRTPQTQSAYM